MTPLDVQQDFRRQTIDLLEKMGISVEYSHHEVAPSQHEIDLRYADALTMADNIMTFRLVVKEVALQRGVYATFMPKPLEGQWGNAMHLHLSLFNGDENAFHDATDPLDLSDTAKAFTAGLLRHAREITAVTNQWVNSYKRLVPGFEAPVHVRWGQSNRRALIRVPMYKPRKGASTPHRVPRPGPGLQPVPGVLGAARRGPEGHRGGVRAPRGDRGQHLRDDRGRASRPRASTGCPRTSARRSRSWSSSELVAEALGEHLFELLPREQAARVGASTLPTSPSSSSTATCRRCEPGRWPPPGVPRARWSGPVWTPTAPWPSCGRAGLVDPRRPGPRSRRGPARGVPRGRGARRRAADPGRVRPRPARPVRAGAVTRRRGCGGSAWSAGRRARSATCSHITPRPSRASGPSAPWTRADHRGPGRAGPGQRRGRPGGRGGGHRGDPSADHGTHRGP